MNRRIVLVDQNEFPEYTKLYGCGLGNEIYTLQFLETLSEEDKENILFLEQGDAALLVKGEPLNIFKEVSFWSKIRKLL